MHVLRPVLLASLCSLVLAGCGHMPTATALAGVKSDWSGVGAMATHVPTRAPNRSAVESSGNVSKLLCNASVEARAPQGFVLTVQATSFRLAEAQRGDAQRMALAKAIAGSSAIMGAFAQWDAQSQDNKLAVLKSIAQLEGTTFGFTAPPMSVKTGIPKDGTMAYFQAAKDGIGQVVLFPKAIAQSDKWAAIATVTHEMRHAYQYQLSVKGSKGQLATGSADETLAYGFAQADKVIDQVGGEDNLSYGDYCHLTNEWDAFATGNMVAKVVSQGAADTSGLGFIDLQFNANGQPLVSLAGLEAQSGAAGLLDAVNTAQQKADQAAGH